MALVVGLAVEVVDHVDRAERPAAAASSAAPTGSGSAATPTSAARGVRDELGNLGRWSRRPRCAAAIAPSRHGQADGDGSRRPLEEGELAVGPAFAGSAAGMRIAVEDLVGFTGGRERTEEEVRRSTGSASRPARPARPGRTAGEEERRRIGVRLGEREVAADRAGRSDPDVGDAPLELGERRGRRRARSASARSRGGWSPRRSARPSAAASSPRSSGRPFRSMSVPNWAKPIFITWSSSVPPAMKAASPSAAANAAKASASVVGRAKAKRGIIGPPHRGVGSRRDTSQPTMYTIQGQTPAPAGRVPGHGA